MKKVSTIPEFQLSFERRLASQNAVYEMENFQIRTYICDSGRTSFVINDVFLSTFAPVKALVFANLQTSSVGTHGTSVFSFARNGISRARLFINEKASPSVEYDFSNKGIIRAFQAYHGGVWTPSTSPIDEELFASSYFFLSFDLNQIPSIPRNKTLANCRLDIEFSAATTANLKFYVFYVSNEQILVNNQRMFQKNF